MTKNRGDSSQNTVNQANYAPVNGLQMYYEVHGSGQPLILIHGGFGVVGMFAGLLPALAETRQVIVVELQGHGHTADVDRPFSFEQMADDIAALIGHLGYDKADVAGFSLGGGVAWQTAVRHPNVVRKLVIISAPCKRDGWYPEVLAGMGMIDAEGMKNTIMYDAYISVAPNPDHFSRLAEKTRQLLSEDYDWGTAVVTLKTPTLLIVGDTDSVSPAHAAEMFGLLGGGKGDGNVDGALKSQLAILPGTDHFTILSRTGLLLPIINSFLDASS